MLRDPARNCGQSQSEGGGGEVVKGGEWGLLKCPRFPSILDSENPVREEERILAKSWQNPGKTPERILEESQKESRKNP